MFCVFCWIFKNNCPGGGVLAQLFCLRGWAFAISLCLEGGFSLPKVPAEWSDLKLTDTLVYVYTHVHTSEHFSELRIGIFIPIMIPCVRRKFRVIAFAYRAKNDTGRISEIT